MIGKLNTDVSMLIKYEQCTVTFTKEKQNNILYKHPRLNQDLFSFSSARFLFSDVVFSKSNTCLSDARVCCSWFVRARVLGKVSWARGSLLFSSSSHRLFPCCTDCRATRIVDGLFVCALSCCKRRITILSSDEHE